ncbi:MAG: N-acetylmuramoyl-L-alanine amidase, partial [Rhodospirillaceae bacterium]|nr:N-acetylmuramoyl-L-alanine amidase [Rhodospirillaceae bacterium]
MTLPFIDWPTPNQDARPEPADEINVLVLHYTGMTSAREALERMRDPVFKVSAHW